MGKKTPAADGTAASTGPVHVPDAGALFQKDRSGDPRIPGDTEGKVNFSSMKQRAEETVAAARASEPAAVPDVPEEAA